MQKAYKKSLFIFRRDLRLIDNSALNAALEKSEYVVACFIFDTRQYLSSNNAYFSDYSFKFLLQSLQELSDDLDRKSGRLYFFNGTAEVIIQKLIQTEEIEAVFFNRDYTPFSRKRDKEIQKLGVENGIAAHQFGDCLLNEPEESKKDDGKPYTVFTPFFKKNSLKNVRAINKLKAGNFFIRDIKLEDRDVFRKLSSDYKSVHSLAGGRSQALKILSNLNSHADYSEKRDYPALDATTKLSAHNKFGTVSVREVYRSLVNNFGIDHSLVRQLYWRDFFSCIAFNFPRVFGAAFIEKFNNIAWENNTTKFLAWCEGRTGFPLVDAGMRELNSTGYMHNRVRMITASFLVKDLHIDWRWGEKYFANKLVDYDPCVNNGSWQWAASTGCDAQPYFRIFNPWLQQEKFDHNCVYIKKWVPELIDTDQRVLHKLYKNNIKVPGYPEPIVDHSIASSIAKELFEQ